MKNKFTLIITLVFCFFCTITFAQRHNNNSKNETFQLKVDKFSYELDSKKPRYHNLSLKNNSNKTLTFNLSETTSEYNKNTNNQNLIVEILSNDLSKPLHTVTLPGKEILKFKVKTIRHQNVRLGSMNISKVTAHLSNTNKKQSVNIETYIPDPNSSGH